MLEKDVEKEIRVYAEERGMIAIKLSGMGNRGKPDRLFFYKGRVLILEVKKPGEKPTRLQNEWLVKFRDMDFDATWTDRAGKGKTIIDNFIRKTDNETDVLKRLLGKVRKLVLALLGCRDVPRADLAAITEDYEQLTGEDIDL